MKVWNHLIEHDMNTNRGLRGIKYALSVEGGSNSLENVLAFKPANPEMIHNGTR